MSEKLLSGQEVFEEFMRRLKEKHKEGSGGLFIEDKVDIYRCTESYNDGCESGTEGIQFSDIYFSTIPGSERLFVLLKGEGVSRGKGHTPIKIQLRRFDVSDVCRLCKDKNMSQKGTQKVVVDILSDGLSIGAALFIVEKHHYSVSRGVIMEIDENGSINYYGRNLNRFCKGVERKRWKPEIVDYLLDSYITGILDSEAAL